MSTNPRNSQYGGASSPERGTGVYTGRVTLIYDDGRVRVFVKTFGRNIGPCRIINKSAGDAISLNDEVLCTYANDISDELIVVGRLTERVDPVSESTSGLVVEASTSAELVRITQKGAGAALLVEDSTNPDSTPFTVDASGKVGIGTTSPAAMLHVTDSSGYGLQVNSTTNLGLLGSNGESDGLRISGGIPDQFSVGGNIYVYGNTHATRAANVTINTNGTEVITINSSGNVGIGNTSPTAKLDITGSALISGSLNKVTITAPATSATLTIANGKTLTTSNTLTLAGTDSTTMTFPSTSQTIAGLAVSSQVFTTAQTFRATSAIRSEAASTQDAIVIAGRAGGTSSYAVTITPATLSASSTLTLPNTTGTVITTGDTGTVTNTMLAGSIANSKTTATSSNTASAIVARDSSGNFTAGTITATLSGSASTLTTSRTIQTSLSSTSASSFDGSANITPGVTGTLAVTNGGTGVTTSTGSGNVVLSASPTFTGTPLSSLGSLSSTSGTTLTSFKTDSTTSNGDSVDMRLIRRTTGTDWSTAYFQLGRLVDATRMGFIRFGSTTNANQTVELGIGSSNYFVGDGSTGTISLGVATSVSGTLSASGNATFNGVATNAGMNCTNMWNSAMGSGSGVAVVNNFGFLITQSSRLELKENIVEVSGQDALGRILGLRPVEFTMKPEYVINANEFTPFDKKRGFIAQEVSAVDHWYGQYGWVNENQQVLTTEALNGELPLEDATTVYWDHAAVIADLVGSVQLLTERIKQLENNQ